MAERRREGDDSDPHKKEQNWPSQQCTHERYGVCFSKTSSSKEHRSRRHVGRWPPDLLGGACGIVSHAPVKLPSKSTHGVKRTVFLHFVDGSDRWTDWPCTLRLQPMHCARDGNESWLRLFLSLQLLCARRATSCFDSMWQTSMVLLAGKHCWHFASAPHGVCATACGAETKTSLCHGTQRPVDICCCPLLRS